MGIIIVILIAAVGLLLPIGVQAGPWTSLTTKYVLPSKPPLKPSPDLRTSACTQPTPYRWNGQCLACTNPSSAGLERTGYVRCDEGFCTNSGLVAIARIFGATGTTVDVRDCATVPAAAPREAAAPTHFGLGTDDYTIGAIAIPYEGQQLGTLQCDPGQVAVRVKAKADTIVRSVTGLDCKPINGLFQAAFTSKTPPTNFGNPAGTETSRMAPNGSALVGFDARYANTLEYDNRIAKLSVLSPVSLDPATGFVANESTDPGEDGGFSTYGTYESTNSPWVRAMCPDKFLMTGVWVVYDSDSVKSVTPTCKRVFAPGEPPASVPAGRFGLGRGSEVGYLGGRTVSNSAVVAAPPNAPGTWGDRKCPEGSVMTGWRVGSLSSFGDTVSVYGINCQDINLIVGDCDGDSPRLGEPDRGPIQTYDDLGREGCAMVGFQYKQQKRNAAIYSYGVDYPRDSQVISELHSTLTNRDQTQSVLQGHNAGQGSGALNCWPHSTYNCNTTDWIDVRCPAGSFMVGVKQIEVPAGLANLGAYCRQVVQGPWTENSDPAPGPALLHVAPVQVDAPTLIKPLAPAP